MLLGRRLLPFGRVSGAAAARRAGQQRRPAVVQRQHGSSGAGDPYRQSLSARHPHGRDRFVEVLLQAVWSGGGLGSDGGSRGGGRQHGLLTGNQRSAAPAVLTLAAVLARLVALHAHRLVDRLLERLPRKTRAQVIGSADEETDLKRPHRTVYFGG